MTNRGGVQWESTLENCRVPVEVIDKGDDYAVVRAIFMDIPCVTGKCLVEHEDDCLTWIIPWDCLQPADYDNYIPEKLFIGDLVDVARRNHKSGPVSWWRATVQGFENNNKVHVLYHHGRKRGTIHFSMCRKV